MHSPRTRGLHPTRRGAFSPTAASMPARAGRSEPTAAPRRAERARLAWPTAAACTVRRAALRAPGRATALPRARVPLGTARERRVDARTRVTASRDSRARAEPAWTGGCRVVPRASVRSGSFARSGLARGSAFGRVDPAGPPSAAEPWRASTSTVTVGPSAISVGSATPTSTVRAQATSVPPRPRSASPPVDATARVPRPRTVRAAWPAAISGETVSQSVSTQAVVRARRAVPSTRSAPPRWPEDHRPA